MTYRMCKGKYVILKRCVQITWRAAHRLPVRLRSQSARDREASRNGIPRRQPPLVLPGAQHESRPGSAPFDRHRSRCHAGGVNEFAVVALALLSGEKSFGTTLVWGASGAAYYNLEYENGSGAGADLLSDRLSQSA